MSRSRHNTALYNRTFSNKSAGAALRVCASLILLCVLVSPALAQESTSSMTPPGLAPGAPAGAYAVSGMENVNLFNGNLNFNLPLLKVGGRGQVGAGVNLAINSVKWGMIKIPMTDPNIGLPMIPSYIDGKDFEPFIFSVTQGCPNQPLVNCLLEPLVMSFTPAPQMPTFEFVKPMPQISGYAFYPVARPDVASGDDRVPGYGPGVVQGRYSSAKELIQHTDESDPLYGNENYHFVQSLYRLAFISSDGTEHELVDTLTDGKPIYHTFVDFATTANRGRIFASTDGSGMTFISDYNLSDFSGDPSGYLFFPDGTRCRVDVGLIMWIRDTDGNVVNYTYGNNLNDRDSYGRVTEITDTLGRKVTITYGALEPVRDENAVTYDEIKFNGVGGNLNRSIKVWHSQMGNALRQNQSLKTVGELFPSPSLVPLPAEENPEKFNPIVTSAVELPDGRKYQLKYNSYGELARAEMPTGAAIEYDYTEPLMLISAIHRRVKERRVASDGANWESKQLFNPDSTSGQANDISNWGTITTVETHDVKGGGDRLVSKEKHYFHSYPLFSTRPELFYPSWMDGLEYKTEQFDTSGEATTVLRREERVWQQQSQPAWWGQASNPPYSPYVAISSNAPARGSRVVTTINTIEPEGANLVSKQTSIDPVDPTHVGFDEFNNRTDLWEFDYGSPGQVGQMLRHTHTNYVKTLAINGTVYDYACASGTSCSQSAIASNIVHIRNLPQSVEVTDSATSKIVSRSEFLYDEPGRLADDYGSLVTNFPGWVEPTTPARGNVTTTRVWLDTLGDKESPQAYLETHLEYDRFGNVVRMLDARDKITEVKFAATYRYALPTETKSADPDGEGPKTSLITANTFDPASGVLLTTTDANGKMTRAEYNDPLDRLTKVIRPDYSWTSYEYGDEIGNLYLHTKTLRESTSEGEKTLEGYQFFDALGRAIRSVKRTDADKWTASATAYDGVGRIVGIASPYETSDQHGPLPESPQWTTTDYDVLGRSWRVTTPDGAKVYTLFSGTRTLVTDQAGNQRISRTDALGRLIDVWEVRSPDAASGTEAVTFPVPQGLSVPTVSAGYRTTYAYDAFGNLRKVEQGGQRRYYAYDSLSRLIRVKNPEQEASEAVRPGLALGANMLSSLSDNNNNWSLMYEYDKNGNLNRRTDARGILTKYTYDYLNRVTFSDYDDDVTPDVTYTYDTLENGKGRLTSVDNGVSITSHDAYDIMGRVTSSTQTTDGVSYPTQEYTYDLAGNLTSQKYPSGRIVTTDYDSAGRLAAVTGQKTGEIERPYVSQIEYTVAGAIKDLRLGNGLWEHTEFNSRLQPQELRLGTMQGGFDRLKLEYDYGAANENNGNVRGQTIIVPSVGAAAGFTAVQSYGYDPLNRLVSAKEMNGSGQVWKQSYAYDRFGNRTIDTGLDQNAVKKTSDNVKPALLSDNPTINIANNQISANQGYGYEGAGNLITVPNKVDSTKSYKYEYDAENRQINFDKDPVTTPTMKDATYVYDGNGRRVKKIADGETIIYVYDASGKLVAEYSSSGSAVGGTSYLTSDTLGTPRIITGTDINDSYGGVKARHDYLPFGEELFVGRDNYTTDNIKQKFTQKERDTETGLDYFVARYYSSSQGRFTSCDPISLTKRHIVNPQKWSLYVYVLNNPLALSDPNGQEDQGSGGARIIDVFINFPAEQKNVTKTTTTTMNGKIVDKSIRVEPSIKPPDWDKLQERAAKAGFILRVWENGKGYPATIAHVKDSLKNSELVVGIGHGHGVEGGKFQSVGFVVGLGSINDPEYSPLMESFFGIYNNTKSPVDVKAKVVGMFLCNSEDLLPAAFNFNGTSTQYYIGVDGGTRNGTTPLQVLEWGAYDLIDAYIATDGKNVKAAADTAQDSIDRSRIKDNDKDKVHTRIFSRP